MKDLYRRGRSLAARALGRRKRNAPKPGDPRYPDWRAILAQDRGLWEDAKRRAAGGPAVLIGSTVGGYGAGSVFESMLAVALTLRGARVHTLICDRALPGCQRAEYVDVPDPSVLVEYRLQERLCDRCYATGQYNFDPLGLPEHRIGRLATRAEKLEARRIAVEIPAEKIRSFVWEGLAIGEHAYAGALRYFARGDLAAEPLGEQVLRRYLEASLLMAAASTRLIQREGIEIAAFNHGLYVPQGVLGEVCRGLGVRVANWNPAYRTSCFIFSHGDTYHHTLMAEPTEAWETYALDPGHGGPDPGVSQEPLVRHPRLDLVPRRAGRGLRGVRPRGRDGPQEADRRAAHERDVGRPAPLPGQRLPEHARLGPAARSSTSRAARTSSY